MSWLEAFRQSLSMFLSLERTFFPPFPQGEPFHVNSLERVKYCWAHLDSISDWTQLRPLYKLLRFSRWGKKKKISQIGTYLVATKTNLIRKSLAYLTCHLPVLSGLPLSFVSSCSLYMGASLWTNSNGLLTIAGQWSMVSPHQHGGERKTHTQWYPYFDKEIQHQSLEESSDVPTCDVDMVTKPMDPLSIGKHGHQADDGLPGNSTLLF